MTATQLRPPITPRHPSTTSENQHAGTLGSTIHRAARGLDTHRQPRTQRLDERLQPSDVQSLGRRPIPQNRQAWLPRQHALLHRTERSSMRQHHVVSRLPRPHPPARRDPHRLPRSGPRNRMDVLVPNASHGLGAQQRQEQEGGRRGASPVSHSRPCSRARSTSPHCSRSRW